MHYVALYARPKAIIVPPGGLQIQLLVGESMSSAQCRGVQGSAGRCRAGRAHAKTALVRVQNSPTKANGCYTPRAA